MLITSGPGDELPKSTTTLVCDANIADELSEMIGGSFPNYSASSSKPKPISDDMSNIKEHAKAMAEQISKLFAPVLNRLPLQGLTIKLDKPDTGTSKEGLCASNGKKVKDASKQRCPAVDLTKPSADSQFKDGLNNVSNTNNVQCETAEYKKIVNANVNASEDVNVNAAEDVNVERKDTGSANLNAANDAQSPVLEKKINAVFSLPSKDDRFLGEESDGGDYDGLKHLWEDMTFCLACVNDNQAQNADPVPETDLCSHDFYLKYNIGLVCRLCGLVGQAVESMIIGLDLSGNAKRRKKKHNMLFETDLNQENNDFSSDESPTEPTSHKLEIHSAYVDKLREHQINGFHFLRRNLVREDPTGCVLAHAPGTGKSFLIIAFLQSFQVMFPDTRSVIVAPKGMLSVWKNEFMKWKVEEIAIFNLYDAKISNKRQCQSQDPEMDDNEYDDSRCLHQQFRQLQMLREWKAQKSVLLVGYSMFSRLVSDKKTPSEIRKTLLDVPGVVILDEGHVPRNKDTQILESLSQVHTKRRVILSGTLFQNNFDELFTLFQLVRHDFMAPIMSCLGNYIDHEKQAKMYSSSLPKRVLRKSDSDQHSTKGGRKMTATDSLECRIFKDLGESVISEDKEKREKAIAFFRQISRTLVHWYKGEVLRELPGLIDLTLMLDMSSIQKETISFVNHTKVNSMSRRMNLDLVLFHPSLLQVSPDAKAAHPEATRSEDPNNSSKVRFVLDLLSLAVPLNEKVLIFSQVLEPFKFLAKVLKQRFGWNLDWEMLKIVGEMSLEERDNVIMKFNQDSRVKLLFASIKTCGEGVSLIGASRIVFLNVSWNPAVTRQAISRAFRIGQMKKVFVYRLVGAETQEEYVFHRSSEKEWLAKQICEGDNKHDDGYETYLHEVDPRGLDSYFESPELRKNVQRCYQCCFF